MEFFLQGMSDMLHNKRRKSKGEKQFISKIYMQEMMQVADVLVRAARAPEFCFCRQKIGKVPDDLPCKRAIK
jgi:hypothetical protein